MQGLGSVWAKWDLHVHSPKSYDVGNGEKNKEADIERMNAELAKKLTKNQIAAAAITDHWQLCAKEIKDLRRAIEAEQGHTVIFPGVELRTDKGSSNIHVIGVFSEQSNLENLEQAFDVFKREYAKPKNKQERTNQNIYFDLSDIDKFVKANNGLLSVHAGNKSNGIDKELSFGNEDVDALLKIAIRDEYRDDVTFLDTNSYKSAAKLRKELVKHYKNRKAEVHELPITVNSDIHRYNKYDNREVSWIKAVPTFNGLKEAFAQPSERICLETTPPQIRLQLANAFNIIHSISISSKKTNKWYGKNLEIQFNPGLVAIIGNKGSGKSALSDVLGLAGFSSNMQEASFLSKKRFNIDHPPLGSQFEAKIKWLDGNCTDPVKLDQSGTTKTPRVEYLPQQFIERIASSIDEKDLQKEIESVIFNAIPEEKRLNQTSWNEYRNIKFAPFNQIIENERKKLDSVNDDIVHLENSLKVTNKEAIQEQLNNRIGELSSLKKNKPKNLSNIGSKELEENNDSVAEKDLQNLKGEIGDIKKSIGIADEEIAIVKEKDNDRQNLLREIDEFNRGVDTLNIKSFPEKIKLNELKSSLKLTVQPNEPLKGFLKVYNDETEKLQEQYTNKKKQASALESQVLGEKAKFTHQQKLYDEYKQNLQNWKTHIKEIESGNNKKDEKSIAYLENEIKFLSKEAHEELMEKYQERIEISQSIISTIFDEISQSNEIYKDASDNLKGISPLNGKNADISFSTRRRLSPEGDTKLINLIDTRKSGLYRGKTDAIEFINKHMNLIVESLEKGSNIQENLNFLAYQKKAIIGSENIPDFDFLEGTFSDVKSAYSYIYGLKFIEINFQLQYQKTYLPALSAGERGLVLLIFYLGLSKAKEPLIIDQPEDNLDNQSIFERLVPYLKKAREKRQIIVVTHNPNIAIAADADQIILANMNKSSKLIQYSSGALEDTEINEAVVKVLEGTKPAFDLREHKYSVVDEKEIY